MNTERTARRTRSRVAACLLAAAMAISASGCFGSFSLTKRLHEWNASIEGAWPREGVFLVLVFVPVYSLAVLGDAIIFNSVEFWTGENPVNVPDAVGAVEASADSGGVASTRTLVDGDYSVVLIRQETAEGREMTLRLFEKDRLIEECVLVRRPDGTSVKKDLDGRLLASARVLPDGSVVIRDSEKGTETRYTPDDIARVLER